MENGCIDFAASATIPSTRVWSSVNRGLRAKEVCAVQEAQIKDLESFNQSQMICNAELGEKIKTLEDKLMSLKKDLTSSKADNLKKRNARLQKKLWKKENEINCLRKQMTQASKENKKLEEKRVEKLERKLLRARKCQKNNRNKYAYNRKSLDNLRFKPILEATIKKEDSLKEIKVFESGKYSDQYRFLINDLLCAGVADHKVAKVVRLVTERLGLPVPNKDVSARTVGRIKTEGGLFAKIVAAMKIIESADGWAGSWDTTGFQGIDLQSVLVNVPNDTKPFVLALNQLSTHTALEQKTAIVSVLAELKELAEEVELEDADKIGVHTLTMIMSDHAKDQTSLHKHLEEHKLKDMEMVFGANFLQLRLSEQEKLGNIYHFGCCLHKMNNASKAIRDSWVKFWIDENDGKDEAAKQFPVCQPSFISMKDALDPAKKCDEDFVTSHNGGGYKATEIASLLFCNRNPNRGHQKEFQGFCNHLCESKHLDFRPLSFGQVSEVRFASHEAASLDLVDRIGHTSYSDVRFFMESLQSSGKLGTLDKFFLEGINCPLTRSELLAMAVLRERIFKPLHAGIISSVDGWSITENLVENGNRLRHIAENLEEVIDYIHSDCQFWDDERILQQINSPTPQSDKRTRIKERVLAEAFADKWVPRLVQVALIAFSEKINDLTPAFQLNGEMRAVELAIKERLSYIHAHSAYCESHLGRITTHLRKNTQSSISSAANLDLFRINLCGDRSELRRSISSAMCELVRSKARNCPTQRKTLAELAKVRIRQLEDRAKMQAKRKQVKHAQLEEMRHCISKKGIVVDPKQVDKLDNKDVSMQLRIRKEIGGVKEFVDEDGEMYKLNVTGNVNQKRQLLKKIVSLEQIGFLEWSVSEDFCNFA